MSPISLSAFPHQRCSGHITAPPHPQRILQIGSKSTWICVSCWKSTQKSGSPCNTHPAVGTPFSPSLTTLSPTSHRQPTAQHFRQKNGKYWKRNARDKPVRASEFSENSTISSHGRSGAAQSSGTIPDTFPLLFQTIRCKNGATPFTARQVKGKNHHLFPKASVC